MHFQDALEKMNFLSELLISEAMNGFEAGTNDIESVAGREIVINGKNAIDIGWEELRVLSLFKITQRLNELYEDKVYIVVELWNKIHLLSLQFVKHELGHFG